MLLIASVIIIFVSILVVLFVRWRKRVQVRRRTILQHLLVAKEPLRILEIQEALEPHRPLTAPSFFSDLHMLELDGLVKTVPGNPSPELIAARGGRVPSYWVLTEKGRAAALA